MSLATYSKNTFSTVEIGGVRLTVRPLGVSDFIEIGEIPTALLAGEGGKPDPKYGNQLGRIVMLNCVIGPPDFRIVDKKLADCAEGEVPLSYISSADTAKVLAVVTSASGLTKEAADSAKPFPAPQAPVS